jgi:hypothetical protein
MIMMITIVISLLFVKLSFAVFPAWACEIRRRRLLAHPSQQGFAANGHPACESQQRHPAMW